MTAVVQSAAPMPELALRRLPDRGLLVRYGDLVLFCEPAAGQYPRLGTLVGAVATAAESPAGARLMSRLLGGLLSSGGPDDYPPLCAFGPTESGLVAIVYGQAELAIMVDGRELCLDGRDAVTVVDRIIAGPVGSVRASVGTGDARLTFDWPQAPVAGPPPVVAAPVVEPAPAAPVVEPAPAAPVEVPVAAAPVVAAPVSAPAPVNGSNGATSTTGTAQATGSNGAGQATPNAPTVSAAPARPDTVQVIGICCKNGHFNDPKMAYCAVCGISMASAHRELVVGNRPQLGVLVVDDGTVSPLVMDHVVGRMPESDTAVAAGQASPVRLIDPLVSAVHARVVLDGWDVRVVDAGSAIGTFVCGPGETAWTPLSNGDSAVLSPGTVVAFGRRQLCYHSYRNSVGQAVQDAGQAS